MRRPAVIIGTWVTLLGGCAFGIAAPVPFVAGESQRTVGSGKTRLDLALAGGWGTCCDWFNGGGGGQARVRYGIAPRHELGASFYAMGMGEEGGAGFPDHLWMAGKLDYKGQLNRFAALLVGAGGGITPRAPFFGCDLGLVVGRPGNRKWVPYGALRVSISIPTEPSAPMDIDEGTGLIEPAVYLIGVAGLQINLSKKVSLVLELGAGGLFPLVSSNAVNPDVTHGGMGGALYGLFGVNLRL